MGIIFKIENTVKVKGSIFISSRLNKSKKKEKKSRPVLWGLDYVKNAILKSSISSVGSRKRPWHSRNYIVSQLISFSLMMVQWGALFNSTEQPGHQKYLKKSKVTEGKKK